MSTHTNLIDLLSDAGQPRGRAQNLADGIFATLSRELVESGRIVLPGLGSLTLRQTDPRTGRNPHTGEKLAIPAGMRVKFTASATLMKRVKGL